MVQCVVGCASSAAWRYGSVGASLEPDPARGARADRRGRGRAGSRRSRCAARARSPACRTARRRRGRRRRASRRCRRSRRRAGVEEVEPDAAQLRRPGRRAPRRSRTCGLRAARRRRRRAARRTRPPSGSTSTPDVTRWRGSIFDAATRPCANICPPSTTLRVVSRYGAPTKWPALARRGDVDELEQVGGVTPRGEPAGDGRAGCRRPASAPRARCGRAPGRTRRSPRCPRPRRTASCRSTRCPSRPDRPR